MLHLDVDLTILAPRARVWEFLLDFDAVPRWQAGIESCRADPPGPPHVGQRIVEVRKLFGARMTSAAEITAIEPPRRLAVRSVPGAPQRFESEYRIDEAPGGTRVQLTLRMESDQLSFKLLRPLLQWISNRDAAARFARLKETLEGEAGQS